LRLTLVKLVEPGRIELPSSELLETDLPS